MSGLVKKYMSYGVAILLIMGIVTAIVDSFITDAQLVTANIISFVFQLVLIAAYGKAWERVAKSSPKNLTVLYMSATGLRLLLAALVLLVYMFTHRTSGSLLAFSVVFVVYYIIILIYDTIFFVSVEKKQLR